MFVCLILECVFCPRRNGIVDCKSLLIESGRARWILYVDVISLNDAGNLFDACMLAVDAALHSSVWSTSSLYRSSILRSHSSFMII